MEYQNVDEAARREACEKVKKIVKAIKAIKIKYYLNFSKISEEDQQTYGKLEENLDRISRSHNLDNLKVELMSEISAKYDRDAKEGQEQKNSNVPDDVLKACYGAIDVQQRALSQGKIKQAIKCQKILKEYMQKIENPKHIEMVINYKREKFGELTISRETVEKGNKDYTDKFKKFYKPADVQKRQKANEQIQAAKNNTIGIFAKSNNAKEETPIL